MAQVSRPLQITLLAAALFGAAWFVALRPKGDSGGSPPPAPVARVAPHAPGSSLPGGLGRAVTKAHGAAAQAGGASPANPGTTRRAGSGSTPVSASARKPVSVPARTSATPRHPSAPPATGAPGRVERALAHGKVVALLFWNPRAADDTAVREELEGVPTFGGRAVIIAASIRDVSRFRAVTRGVQILQSPTVVVIDRARRARLLTGYTDYGEITQAVSNALGAG